MRIQASASTEIGSTEAPDSRGAHPHGADPHEADPRSPGRHPRTRAVRAGVESDSQFGAVVPPLHLSSNFTFAGYAQPRRYDYTRSGNPTRSQLAETLAELECGAGAVITASGMAAVTLVVQLLEPGQLLLAPHDCYGGTYRLFRSLAERGSFDVRFVDLTDPGVVKAVAEPPAMVWVETPSNPLLRITDLAATAAWAKEQGALVVVDNTFLSPALQRPIEHGADLVLHSTTKYLNGHSDVVGGAVIARTADLTARIEYWANCLGIAGAPFDSYLTLRGVRTLHARLRLHEQNAWAIAQQLGENPAVARVFFPGLPEHPGHEIADRQQDGWGAMLSFELRGGAPAVRAFLDGLRCFSLAESLGGVESLIAHPATMTHASMDVAAREKAGIGEGLLRISVGIEEPGDLLADLGAALDRARAATPSVTGERPVVETCISARHTAGAGGCFGASC